MFGTGAFRTDLPTPTLLECLERAKAEIEVVFSVRGVIFNPGVTFADEWGWIRSEGEDRPDYASEFDDWVEIFRTKGTLPEVYFILRASMSLWFEAESAHQSGDLDRAWAALVRCNFFLGMCCSHESHRERSSRAGRNSAKRTLPLREMVLEMLSAMPDKSRATKQEIWDEIVPAMSSFIPPGDVQEGPLDWVRKLGRPPTEQYRETFHRRGKGEKSRHGRSADPAKLLRTWTNNNEEIRQQFFRVVAGPLTTRRKRSSKA
ncbi:hypothetical protein [Stenotrophomonas sp. TWI1409]|uniref:hypothetical protein n=1 Tax=unclassified Stenotrophomonas TaxID=196198 RepID=UPI0032086316